MAIFGAWEKKIRKNSYRSVSWSSSLCLPLSVPLPPTVSVCQSAGVGVKDVKNGCLLSVWYYSHHWVLPPPALLCTLTGSQYSPPTQPLHPPSHDTHLQLSCQLLCPLSDPVFASHTQLSQVSQMYKQLTSPLEQNAADNTLVSLHCLHKPVTALL